MQAVALIDSTNTVRSATRQWSPRPAPDARELTVAVGHSSTLVAAGLAATLRRIPGCDVKLWQISPAASDFKPAPPAQLVFGDSTLLKSLREQAKDRPAPHSLARAKFVLVTMGDDYAAQASKANGEIDECLSIECQEDELFATVQRLIEGSLGWSVTSSVGGDPSESVPPAIKPLRPPRREVRGGLAPCTLRRVHEHIEHNLTGNLLAERLAAIAKLSPGHFNRAFRQSTGKSPHQYITHRRVALAAELLERTSRALADIALDVGFADQSHFCRTFALVTGETPSARRRRNR